MGWRKFMGLGLAVLAVVLYFRYQSTPPPAMSGPDPGGAGPETGRAGKGSYALSAANSWPPDVEGAEQPGVAANLFAANYYVVLDGSGSMNGVECSAGQRKVDAARVAVAAFAQSVPANANLGLAVFDRGGLSERLPLVAGNRERFVRALEAIQADGGTPLRSAVELAYGKLLAQGRRQLGYGEYHLVTVTDGRAYEGQDPTRVVDEILAESPIVLHTIGFCIDERHSLNQPGRTFYQAADNPEVLRRGLSQVLAEAPEFSVTKFGN
jgi:Ca-activated chloride channel family protein